MQKLQQSNLILVFVLSFYSLCSAGVVSNPLFHGYNIRQWGQKAGIPENIQAMVRTPDGYLWLGNEHGITRFDGSNATLFNRHSEKTLTEDDCYSLFVTHDSILYCGLYNGLVVSYGDGHFKPTGGREVFKDKSILGICEDHLGNLYFATDGAGVIRFDGKNFSAFTTREGLPSDGIQAIC
ncbi:MAG: two-component regulator propeller domain-containing protein, partial [bacterium]